MLDADGSLQAGGVTACYLCSQPAVAEGLCAGCALRAVRAARRADKRRAQEVRPGPLEDRLLLVAEVADRLRCSKVTVYRLVSQGRLRGVRVGGTGVRVKASSLARFLSLNPIRRVA